MNSLGEAADQRETSTARSRAREAFTLVEILIVISIIILLMTLMGAVIGNTVKKAREAATATLIEKIDKLLDERTKGFDRATKSLDFQRVIALASSHGKLVASPSLRECCWRCRGRTSSSRISLNDLKTWPAPMPMRTVSRIFWKRCRESMFRHSLPKPRRRLVTRLRVPSCCTSC